MRGSGTKFVALFCILSIQLGLTAYTATAKDLFDHGSDYLRQRKLERFNELTNPSNRSSDQQEEIDESLDPLHELDKLVPPDFDTEPEGGGRIRN